MRGLNIETVNSQKKRERAIDTDLTSGKSRASYRSAAATDTETEKSKKKFNKVKCQYVPWGEWKMSTQIIL